MANQPSRKVIRNILTKDLLLLLAQANSMRCPYVDVYFDIESGTVLIRPISPSDYKHRMEGKDNKPKTLDMEDVIDDI